MSNIPLTIAAASKYGFDDTALDLILSKVPEDVSDEEIAMFLYKCHKSQLDPLSNQIYLVARWDKRERRNVGTAQTGIDGYRLIAERTGRYAGSEDAVFDGELSQYEHKQTGRKNPDTATVTVKKLVGNEGGGVLGEFTATAEWDAYCPSGNQDFMWRKMPYVMLSKCAEALALRKAFPNELSGIYTSEEMMQAGEASGDITVDDLFESLDIKNKNAVRVIQKLGETGVAEDDEELVSIIGQSVSEIENTDEGTNLLRAVWAFATNLKKGVSKEDALVGLADSLVPEVEEEEEEEDE